MRSEPWTVAGVRRLKGLLEETTIPLRCMAKAGKLLMVKGLGVPRGAQECVSRLKIKALEKYDIGEWFSKAGRQDIRG